MAGLPATTTAKLGQSPTEQRKAVAGQFEAILLRQFLEQSVGAMMGQGADGSSGGGSTGGGMYSYMLTDVFANKLSEGQGMGLSKIIEQQLTPRGLSSLDAADSKGSS